MKRYAFTIILAIVGIVSISLFYAYVNRTVSAHEKISIETVSGDDGEVANVKLFGIMNNNDVAYSISMSKNDTEIGSNSIISLDNMNYVYNTADARLSELQEEYRSFMRGKKNTYSLYEDKEFLIYGDVLDDFITAGEILISMYDKAKAEEWEITIPLPEELNKSNYIYVGDVQLYNQEVVLMIIAEQDHTQYIYRAAVNVNQNRLSDFSLIYSLDTGWEEEGSYYNNHLSINETLVGSSWMTKAKYMPFRVTKTEEASGDLMKETNQFFVVNMESGESFEVNLPEKITIDSNLFVDNENVYYIDKKTGELYKYNFEKASFDYVLKHEAFTNLDYTYLFEFTQNKLYFLSNGRYNGESPTVRAVDFYVLDLKTEQELYHGRIDYKDFKDSYVDFTSIAPRSFD